MISAKEINNQSFEISINGKVQVVDSDNIDCLNKNELQIRLNDTIWDNEKDILKLTSNSWENLLPKKESFQIEFFNRPLFRVKLFENLIKWLSIERVDNKKYVTFSTFSLDETPYFWTSKYSAKYFFDKLLERTFDGLKISKEEIYLNESGCYYLSIQYQDNEGKSIFNSIQNGINLLDKACNSIIQEIKGFKWKDRYLTDESFFTQDFLLPLLRDLGYQNIIYNHGIKEYGKDILMSTNSPLGFEEFIGVQVKKDNIRGSVNSQIDEIIGQIEDAFTMPFYLTNNKEPKYISSFIVAISGQFTDNAKEKIMYKIQNKIGRLMGSVYFLDREKLMELRMKKL